PELADWLTGWLEEDRTRKVLVIGGTKRDVDRLYEAMRERTGVAMARFHEAMPLVECDRQAAWFSEPEGARLLIASEAGGEGRNFQFAQHLVLFDLPDHPEMIEQRIGRLDRIGQKGDIHVYVPYQPGSRDEARLRWMHEGLDAFETPLAGGHMLYQRFRDRLDRVDTRLIQETRKAREQLRRDMEKGRDKLLELNSNRPGEAEPLLQAIREADQDPELESYLLRLLDLCGVHADGLSEHEYLLTRGHLFADLLALPEDGLRFTLNRARALARDDMDFMSWDHPLLLGAMAAVAGSELGRCSAGMSREVESPRLECGFLLEAVAPPELGLVRFLPPAPVFVCLDRTGKPVAPVRGRLAPVPAHLLVDDRILNRESLAAWVQSAEGAAEAIAETLREQALGAMRSVLGGELQRLHALQKINDMIRPEELAALAERITQLQTLIQKSQLRLDSILVVFPER
ncbi:MAG: RNA polymerase-binding ATPase, partial [Kiritimatiellae bacterium]|nr:RNA polymerase-binding ATPase [Kiritimatiellia bacterium]